MRTRDATTVVAQGARTAPILQSESARLELAPKVTISNKTIHLMNMKWKNFRFCLYYESIR